MNKEMQTSIGLSDILYSKPVLPETVIYKEAFVHAITFFATYKSYKESYHDDEHYFLERNQIEAFIFFLNLRIQQANHYEMDIDINEISSYVNQLLNQLATNGSMRIPVKVELIEKSMKEIIFFIDYFLINDARRFLV